MAIDYKTFVVINPKSSDGSTGKKITKLVDKLKKIGEFDYKLTKDKSHATELTRNAIKGNYNRIIAVGGDGTFNEVVNGFFINNEIIKDNIVLGLISGGTGADFIRTLEIPSNIDKAIYKIVDNNIKKIDLGKVTATSKSGDKITRYFLNASNIGLGGDVVKKVNNSSKVLGGFTTFLVKTISTAMEFKNKKLTLTYDEKSIENIYSNIIVANGKYCGGGMKFLPDASLDDELFDILTIGDINKVEFFENILKVYQGTHLKFHKIGVKKSKTLSIDSNEKVRIEADGEECGFTPAKFEIIPKILNIIY
ncbi:MAG: diacylglycerol kinase family protein [Candidatus Sericytochromatia bacterium]